MTPGTLDLTIYKGITFGRTLTCLDADGVAVDLTGYTAQADVRQKPTSPHVSFDLNAAIAVDPTTGVITLSLTDTETDALTAGFYGWDLVLINGGDRLGPFIIGGVNVQAVNSQP